MTASAMPYSARSWPASSASSLLMKLIPCSSLSLAGYCLDAFASFLSVFEQTDACLVARVSSAWGVLGSRMADPSDRFPDGFGVRENPWSVPGLLGENPKQQVPHASTHGRSIKVTRKQLNGR